MHKRRLDLPNEFCRYSDIRTYSDNKVEINSEHKYINASWIHLPEVKYFIATQGPLESTIQDFWEMCLSYNVKVILMLCNLKENNIEKCKNYWEANLIRYEIKKLKEYTLEEGIIIRELEIKNKNYNIGNIIVQIQLTTWDDHTASITNYNKLIKIIQFIDNKKQNCPAVVHCSAGVGRTGTFLSLYNLYHEILEQIKDKNKKEIIFSIWNLVRKLKEMRLYLVENKSQYLFLYQFVNILLKENN